MAIDTEPQQVAIALMEETDGSSCKKLQNKSKTSRLKKNYCTEDYIIGYGVPIIIIIIVILGLILTFIAILKYNRNCKHSKGASCRGMQWFFT
jgi:hypothetical protein